MNTATVPATAATVSPFIQNLQQQQPQKPQTSKEAIAANVKALIEQLEEGHSEGLTAYLTAMGRFHNYSFGNILEIARQKPSATRVAGMYAWNQLGRRVNKGEKGIRILAPMTGVRRKKDNEAAKDVRKQNQSVLVGFRSVYVFDVSQTEGLELPELSSRVSGDVGERMERLLDFLAAQDILLEFKESIAPALGMSYGAGIGVRETGIRKRIRGIAESRNRGFGIYGCAHLCARNVRNSANSPPGNAESGPGNPPETPELANNYGFRSLAGTLAPEL